ncbi:MAG: hypothetical protein K9M44_02740 [Candidatus Pacebacteria bacterium]|nr:hypothetical protein [Candidatus Paceibacterota bacterium]
MNFFKRYQKILLVIGFLVLVAIIGYFIWITFFKPFYGPEGPGSETATNTSGRLPEAGQGQYGSGDINDPGNLPQEPTTDTDPGSQRPDQYPEPSLRDDEPSPIAIGGVTKTTRISNTQTLGASLSADGRKLQYYDYATGQFYRLDQNGNTELLSDKVFHQVQNVTWSPQKNTAILEYPDGSNIVYDFDRERQVTLPAHWEDFEFSSSGDQIVAKSLGLDPENRYLIVSNTDGSEVKALEYIGENDDKVYPNWSPNNQVAAMYTKSLDFDRQNLYFIGLNNENFKSTVIEGRGLTAQWSEKGDKLLYSAYNSNSNLMPELWIVNAQGNSTGTGRKKLNVQTWADKCTFSNDRYVYCAVPKELPEGAGLFPELALRTSDDLYKIDTITGLKSLVAVPDGNYNISELMLSPDNSNLYFTDLENRQIYNIRLK